MTSKIKGKKNDVRGKGGKVNYHRPFVRFVKKGRIKEE